MKELLPLTEVGTIRTHFREFGHVGISGVYEPGSISAADIYTIRFSRSEPGAQGEGRANIDYFNPDIATAKIQRFFRNVGRAVHAVDENIWLPDCTYFIQHVTMLGGTVGKWHPDRHEFHEAVAVTTPVGASRLEIEDGADYPIVPGVTILMDPNRQLEHRGAAEEGSDRHGLVIAR